MIREGLLNSLKRLGSSAGVGRLLLLLAAIWVFGIWVWGADTPSTALNGDPRSTLTGLVGGTAHNPFVQRVFVPLAVRGIYHLLPEQSWEELSQYLAGLPKFTKEVQRLGWESTAIPEHLLALMVAFAALAGSGLAFRSLYGMMYNVPLWVLNTVPAALLLTLPPFFHTGTHYIYDFPALFFFTWGTVLVLRRRWTLFYPVYVLALLNKETAVLLAFVWLLTAWKVEPRRAVVLHAAIQVLLFAAVKVLVILAFSGNPGGSVEFRLWSNLHILLMPYTFATLGTVALLAVLFAYDMGRKPAAARRLAWLVAPFSLLMLFFGTVGEIRALYEIVPVVWILMSHTLLYSLGNIEYKVIH